jgi:hypothetical protein
LKKRSIPQNISRDGDQQRVREMKILSIVRRLLERRKARRCEELSCAPQYDPLDHPEIKRMTALELADLPFDRGCGRR